MDYIIFSRGSPIDFRILLSTLDAEGPPYQAEMLAFLCVFVLFAQTEDFQEK